ncbi:uncharacterized protein N7484_004141 [Penicillium longicatenatum]|uniref:uncharacterized protein n=1 Tax=Penicillium longicatenatum TaxID=1561947 RepID=UPI0025471AE2|nr:uncharacterized protein N7484_004141 [Penicillium longicatenatum]KAJ5650418.1 hypothetical protein N7484_004141 [Penicillium longicatenatum]
MEHLFSAFVRVIRDLDDADSLLATFQEFENNPSALSAEDRMRLLGFPDLITQVANIAAIVPTTSNKQDFLKKAAESPRDLTSSEIDLLQSRYWGKLTFNEKDAFEDALYKSTDISYEHRTETLQRLRDFQSHLYEQYEAKAIANALDEDDRRLREMDEAEKREEIEIMLQHGQPWLRQLWLEDEGKKAVGLCNICEPLLEVRESRLAIACCLTIQSRYTVEFLDWPSSTPTRDESFLVTLGELRKQFNHLRSFPPKKEISYLMNDLAGVSITSMPEGFTVGILRNVFLYIDGNSAASVLENRLADDFWIGAVDPDYMTDTEDQNSSGYQGYLRVRLQQLIHNLYVTRRWHADEVSLEDLWMAAQKDPHNGSFVSMKDEEIFARGSTWEVATALRSRNTTQ